MEKDKVTNPTKKEGVRIFGVRVGSINSELIERYCKKNSIGTHQKAVKFIIEKYILEHPISSKTDIDNATYYTENTLYNSLTEAVEAVARKEVGHTFKICANCTYFKNKTCSFHNSRVNRYDRGCESAEWIEDE